jgi:acyl-CoA synthetase (AMP-forming)/AMP-acid ligase II
MPDSGPLSSLLGRGEQGTRLIAFQHDEPRYFDDLELLARRWRSTFEAAPGRRFVVHSTDALEFAAAMFGAWYAGKCVLVPSDSQATSFAQLGVAVDGHVGMEGGMIPGEPSSRDWQPLDSELPMMEIFTSGSTGVPLCIPKNLRQLDHELAGLAATLDLGPLSARVVGTVSHQHMYGIVFRLLLPLVTGRPFATQRLVQVQDLARLRLAKGCVLVSSPAQLARLSPGAPADGRVHALLSAGGPLDEAAAHLCREQLRVVPTEIYGSSETGAVAWRYRNGGTAHWQPLPGVEFRSEDSQLQIRSPQLPTLDWFRSADRVTMTGSAFELVGRDDRIVKLDEKRVSLDAVEHTLQSTGLVRQVRALVLQGARPVLAVIAMPTAAGWELAGSDKSQLVAALTQALRRNPQAEVLPRSWRFVDPWPITVDGKSPQSLLRARFDRRVPEFRLLQGDDRSCVAELWVSPTVPYFKGHFPEQPILPGVVQIDWLVWLARELLALESGFAGLEAAKFRRVIRPGSRLRVSLANDSARIRTSYQIAIGEDVCASGRIRWCTT